MKLFVDDIRNPPDDTWTLARTVTEAIRAISRFDFEVISLDHDISHYGGITPDPADMDLQTYPCEETYAAVAYFIAEKYGFGRSPVPKVILHTSNDVAGDEMALILGAAGVQVEKKYTGHK